MKTKQHHQQQASKTQSANRQPARTKATTTPARHFNVTESQDAAEMENLNAVASLSEYRLLYPYTAGIPTITQSSVLGLVLARVRRRELRKELRHARLQKVLSMPVKALGWLKEEIALFTHTRPVTSQRHA